MVKRTNAKMQTIQGKVTRIVPKTGFVERCSECGRVVHNNHCVVHIDAEIIPSLRIKAKVEDRDEVLIMKTPVAKDILGISVDDAEVLPKKDVMNLIKNRVFKENFKFHGNKLDDNNFFVKDYERGD